MAKSIENKLDSKVASKAIDDAKKVAEKILDAEKVNIVTTNKTVEKIVENQSNLDSYNESIKKCAEVKKDILCNGDLSDELKKIGIQSIEKSEEYLKVENEAERISRDDNIEKVIENSKEKSSILDTLHVKNLKIVVGTIALAVGVPTVAILNKKYNILNGESIKKLLDNKKE